MTRAFYAMPRPQQRAFRLAIATVRDSLDSGAAEQAFRELDIERAEVDRTHTQALYARAADRLALLDTAERGPIETALFGGPAC